MSETLMNAEDVAATLTAFSISLVAALKPERPNEVLTDLAKELSQFSQRASGTPTADALQLIVDMLVASEPSKPEEWKA